MTVLDYTFIDAGLPKGEIPRRKRFLRRYRGVLDHTNKIQETGWWCGPTSAQMALLLRGISVPQSTLASKLGTTVNGTNYVGLFPPVLNSYLPEADYVEGPYAPKADDLWDYVTASIDAGYGVIANIVATKGVDAPSFYPAGDTYHYTLLVGYKGTRKVDPRLVTADSANFNGVTEWEAPLSQWVSLLSAKGISPATGGGFLNDPDWIDGMSQLGPS